MEENNQALNTPPAQNLTLDQTPVAPSNPVPNNPKLKLPILIAGIILFLVLIGSASAYFILSKQKTTEPPKQIVQTPSKSIPSPDPTVTWKTYQVADDKSGVGTPGFSIKYPNDWVVTKSVAASAGVLAANDKKLTIFMSNDPVFPQGLAQVKPNMALDTPAGPVSFFSYTNTDTYPETTITAFISHNNYFYTFELSGFAQNVPQFESSFHQMLQTLVFNKTSPGKDTSSWQTYTNTQYMFSLLYPKGISLYANQLPISPVAGPSGLYISIAPNPNNLSAHNFAEKDVQQNKGSITGEIIQAPSNFSGLDAIITGGIPSGQGISPIAYISRNSTMIILYFVGVNGRNTANAILSTFKFTN